MTGGGVSSAFLVDFAARKWYNEYKKTYPDKEIYTMKKLLALFMAAIFVAAALASCTTAPNSAINANIRVTSSDGESAAAWLTARLGDKLTDRIAVGTAADGYGVDVSSLEDDGYFIRALDGEVALLAKSATGLDRAVRKYAKAVEAGEAVADETYHEGCRVKELRLAGNDISTFAITVEGENGSVKKWVTTNAAGSLAKLVKIACGTEIAVGGEAQHKIIFRQIADGSFKESSYHFFFSDGDLVFEYVDVAGARNGMVRFLENECGWNDLYYGFDELCEADLVDVPADAEERCDPRFGGIRMTSMSGFYTENTLYSVCPEAFTYKYRIASAHHYLGSVWAKQYGCEQTGHLICLTDEYIIEDTAEELCAYVKTNVDAGAKIGEGFDYINLGMEDANSWCTCKNCLEVVKRENNSFAGPMVQFANTMDDALDAAGYDGIKLSIFAYAGSNPPPKSSPHDDIYVTFVCDSSCTHHSLNGTQCTGKTLSVPSAYGGRTTGNNREEAAWISGWCDVAEHVYVRPAPLLAPLHSFTIIDQTYDDIVFLTECGVECIYDEIYSSYEFDTNLIVTELWEAMLFDPEMTRADYYAEAARLFEKYYGDGWQSVYDYVGCLEETELAKGCWSAWNSYAFLSDATQYDNPTFRALWDRMLSSLADAEQAANSSRQEDRVKRLEISALYNGCYASYYIAYENSDDERIALLEERWAQMLGLLKDVGLYDSFHYGISPYGLEPHYPKDRWLLYDTVEETAWIGAWETSFYHDRDDILNAEGYVTRRPAPEKYTAE